ncbi:hypothetical protein AB0B25_27005 [Nocardia sp. NPDC049190]|uniref:hypothetical protein n=1 Tax=Nocardia sp. NPDC049190 TaxID=3155650 RepID=UPI0033EE775C
MATTVLLRRFRLVGNVIRLVRDPLQALAALPAQGDIVPIGLGRRRAFVICDPELMRQVLVDDRTYDKGGVLAERGRAIVGNGLVTCGHAPPSSPAAGATRLPQRLAARLCGDDSRTGRRGERSMVRRRDHRRTGGHVRDQHADRLRDDARDRATSGSPRWRGTWMPSCRGGTGVFSFQRSLDRVPTPGRRRCDHAVARLRGLGADIIAGSRAADGGAILSVLAVARDERMGARKCIGTSP